MRVTKIGSVCTPLVGKGREGARQLVDVRLRRAEAQRRHGIDEAADTHVVDEVRDGRRLLGLLHDPGRVVVAAARQAPLERMKHPVVLDLAGLLRRPGRAVGRLDRYGQVRDHRAGGHAQVVDGKGVDEGLDRRTDLALALLGHVVLEVTEVRAAHVGLHIARAGIHRYERRTHDALVVENRVARGHHRVALALEGKDLHRTGACRTTPRSPWRCIRHFSSHGNGPNSGSPGA